jgi:hypothetical protein
MFGSSVLDVAIGLIFIFLLLSLICSAANELIEMILKKRAKDLERGISELVGDPEKTNGFLKAIYEHGMINGLFFGVYKPGSGNLPSYIPARNFALAILKVKEDWTAVPEAGGAAKLLPNNVRTAFEAMEQAAVDDAAKLQQSIEDWYNSAMERVSGWYKRRSQFFILILGLIIAVLVNADCIQIAQRLSADASLRQGIVALAQAAGKESQIDESPVDTIQKEIKTLNTLGLPIGWKDNGDETAKDPLYKHILGWILTALAVSLGAPFWFDLLNKFMVVRSTVKPDEKSGKEASKDATKSGK